MTSATSNRADERPAATKSEWAEPSVVKLDVGDAEASDGPGPDGGLAS